MVRMMEGLGKERSTCGARSFPWLGHTETEASTLLWKLKDCFSTDETSSPHQTDKVCIYQYRHMEHNGETELFSKREIKMKIFQVCYQTINVNFFFFFFFLLHSTIYPLLSLKKIFVILKCFRSNKL